MEAELPLTPIGFQNDVGVYSDSLSEVFVDAGMAWRLELVQPSS